MMPILCFCGSIFTQTALQASSFLSRQKLLNSFSFAGFYMLRPQQDGEAGSL